MQYFCQVIFSLSLIALSRCFTTFFGRAWIMLQRVQKWLLSRNHEIQATNNWSMLFEWLILNPDKYSREEHHQWLKRYDAVGLFMIYEMLRGSMMDLHRCGAGSRRCDIMRITVESEWVIQWVGKRMTSKYPNNQNKLVYICHYWRRDCKFLGHICIYAV